MHSELRQRKPLRSQERPADDNSSSHVKQPACSASRMQHIFGFSYQDFRSWESFVILMNRPMDPASLGITRFLFGLLMSVDIPQERGLGHADFKWGGEHLCRFPLFDFLEPLPLNLMYMVYLVMLIGAIGIMLGLFYRVSCVLFIIPYWYVFFLDKTSWNNHSYLYGLLAIILLFTDANRYWSLDGLIWKKIRNKHVPLWNYCVLRSQVFLVYFIAGLKKLDLDWMTGYSMQNLSSHWVFMPFKLVLTDAQVDMYIVHLCGLTLDLFIGFFLFFDKTRPFAFFFGSSFHLMNSQIFSIGMFPFMMLATLPVFCYADWPRRLLSSLPYGSNFFMTDSAQPGCSDHCLYVDSKPQVCKNDSANEGKKKESSVLTERPFLYHKTVTFFTVLYIICQCFIPYSHFLTKGYNNWTNGLYGYSWDMMVHSWSTQHIKISYYNKDTGETGYLNPKAWLEGSNRWSSHADMVKQYATCIQKKLVLYNLTDIELRFDIWRSMNGRFQQRMFDPRVDVLTAHWHPFHATSWHMPLLEGLSDWRKKLQEMESQLMKSTNHTDIVFVADFPGLYLENYVHEDLGNTSVQVLSGEVLVQLLGTNQNVSLTAGMSVQVPAGQYHNVHTVSAVPSCYMYLFVNTTEANLVENITKYEQKEANKGLGITGKSVYQQENEDSVRYRQLLEERNLALKQQNITMWERIENFWAEKYFIFSRAIQMTSLAFVSVITEEDFKDLLKKWDVSHSIPEEH